MTPIQVPYLCGGTLFSLLLQARKARTKARNRYNGGTDGLKDTDVMMGLVKVVTGDCFDVGRGTTFGKCTTQFKTCQDYGVTYIPFTDATVISAFNTAIKQKDPDLLNRMSEFISRFINESRVEWLVKALLEVIQDDADIPENTVFSVSADHHVPKDEIDSITDVNLPVFLLSILSFILNYRPDNTKGRSTFETWHTQSGSKSQWKYNANVGDSITRSISVNTICVSEKAEMDGYAVQSPAAEASERTASDRINDKILAVGKVLADVWGKAIENLADEMDGKTNPQAAVMQLPEEQPSDAALYSSDDKSLLQEFTADYDEIMSSIIGENYAAALADMTMPLRIKDLYDTKWESRADAFKDPTLKSYVYGLLGELNRLSNNFITGGINTAIIKSIRTKIRNFYVKLHPGSYSEEFPYDAFIDDWNDGEF